MKRSATIFLSLALVLAACSPGDSEGDTTTTGADGEVSTTGSPDEASSTTSQEPAETSTTEAQAAGGSSCVEGSWMLTPDAFAEVMQEVAEGEADFGDAEITPSDGTYLVTMSSDGTFTGERDDWGFSVVTPDGTFNIRINGSESGTWSADDSTITVTISESDVTVDASAEVDGQVINLPESPVDVPDAIADSSAYTCDGDTLAVTTEDVTITLTRA